MEHKSLSEEKYLTIFNAVNDAIIILDAERIKVVDINNQAFEQFGYTTEEFATYPFQFMSDAEGGYTEEKVIKYINEALKGDLVIFEWKGRNKKGDTFWIEVQLKIVQIDNSSHLLAIIKNIDNQKRTELNLKENEEQYRILTENSPDIITRLDRNYRHLFVNRAISKITHLQPIDCINKTLSDLRYFPEELCRFLESHINKVFHEKNSHEVEFNFTGATGRIFLEWRIYPELDKSGEVKTVLTIARDITQRKKQENIQNTLFGIANAVNTTPNLDELFISIQHTLGTVMDTKNCYVALYDAENETLSLPFLKDEKDSFNVFPAGKTLTAYVINTGKAQLVNKDRAEQLERENLIEPIGTPSESWLGVPLKHGSKIIGVFAVQSYNKDIIYTENDVQILEFVSDQIALAIERKSYEENLKIEKTRAEESDKLKTAFLSNMSHEIRTPMNAIIGFAGLLSSCELTDDERKEFIEQINHGAETLMFLIDDILDISKIEAGQLLIQNSEFILSEMMNDLRMMFSKSTVNLNKNNIRLIEDNNSFSTDIQIKTDKHRLKQVFSNLLNNALKFTEKGEIRYGIKSLTDDFIHLYVKDTGIGINEENLNLIFERFRQAYESSSRLYSGTGLGLAISRNLIELMGGTIAVTSSIGNGTEFVFTIPWHSSVVKKQEKTDDPATVATHPDS